MNGRRYCEARFSVSVPAKRKKWMKPLEDDEIPEVVALGRQIVEQMTPDGKDAAELGRSGGLSVPLEDPANTK